MKMQKFETLYREMKYYQHFAEGDEVVKYNCFMNEIYSRVCEQEDFEYSNFEYFLQSWRWNAQQRRIGNGGGSTKKFLNNVFDSYFKINAFAIPDCYIRQTSQKNNNKGYTS